MPWTYVISDLNGEEIVASFYEKEYVNTSHHIEALEETLK